jgi:DNA-binding NtrC family response regulator
MSKSLRIVAVDDDPLVLKAVTRALAHDGHSVEARASAGEAFSGDLGKVDLVIADVAMPGINGIQLARILRATNSGIAMVIMSGDAGHMEQCATDKLPFLLKPFTIDELRRAVEEALEDTAKRTAITPPSGISRTSR